MSIIYTEIMNWIIVGLGNPGGEYKNTRHNAGFLAVDFLQDKFNFSDWKKKIFSNATISTGEINSNNVTLIKPETFMNLSGRAVSKYIKTREDIGRLIVIQDDVHLPIGTFKISFGKGDGGHNGITSLHQILKSKDFIRIRIGISPVQSEENQNYKIKLDDFVLGKFTPDEKDNLLKVFPEVEKSIHLILLNGIDVAMNISNTK